MYCLDRIGLAIFDFNKRLILLSVNTDELLVSKRKLFLTSFLTSILTSQTMLTSSMLLIMMMFLLGFQANNAMNLRVVLPTYTLVASSWKKR